MHRWPVPIPPDLDHSGVPERLEACARSLGLEPGERLTLKTLPSSVHWHLKRPGEAGVLEATWDPSRGELWLGAHVNRVRPWVAPGAQALCDAMAT